MVIVTDLNYALEDKLIKKIDLMCDRCTQDNPKKDALLIVEGSEGEGKCLKKGSMVLMADGSWKKVEEIKEGDLVLSPQQDGTNIFSKVTALSNWFCEDSYNVEQLNKKNKILYTCSGNHSIPINTGRGKPKKWKIENMEAKDYSILSKSRKTNSTSLSSFIIDRFMNQDNCKVEPYCLGVFLGDGSFSNRQGKNRIHKKLLITNSDDHIMEEVSKFYPIMNVCKSKERNTSTFDFSLNGDFAKGLEEYGLLGKGSGEKFIPQQALLSDSDYRLRLLAGLIDTDGYYYHGGYQFTLKSKRLIEDIRNLVYSLGGRCGEIRPVTKKIKSIGFEGKYFALTFYLGTMILPLKKDYKIKKANSFYISPNRVSVDVVKSEPCHVYGFSIDSPSHWFITNDWMITHNSNTSVAIAYYIKIKTGREVYLFFRLQEMIEFAKRNKDKIIIWDEPSLDSLSTDHYTRMNKDLMRLMMTCRKLRHFFIFNMTKFYKFNEYIVVDRSLGMVHMYSRKGIQAGRFVYLRQGDLEQLFNLYKSKKKRGYRELSKFRGNFPNIMEKHFDKMDFTVGKVAHATYFDYETEKDKAIHSIGDDFSGASVKEIKINKKLQGLQYKVSLMAARFGIKQADVAKAMDIKPRTLREWRDSYAPEPNSLEKPDFEGGGESNISITRVKGQDVSSQPSGVGLEPTSNSQNELSGGFPSTK